MLLNYNCPKCASRMFDYEKDYYGETLTCLCCGWNTDAINVPKNIRESVQTVRPDGSLKTRQRNPQMAKLS